MLNFTIDRELCTACGECAADCPARIIALPDGVPAIPAGEEEKCYGCQHCLAVCPTGALSILGRKPADESALDASALPTPAAMETLIRGRRSVRRFRDENLPAELVARLIEVAVHAPTGVNARGVRYALIDDREVFHAFRETTYAALAVALRGDAHAADPRAEFYGKLVELWNDKRVDTLFRGAPHFLAASAPADCPTPQADCLIALSYFELYARTNGAGCVWNGMMRHVLDGFAPELKVRLGIPDDHLLGYCISFGPPAVTHHRTVRRAPPAIHRVGRA